MKGEDDQVKSRKRPRHTASARRRTAGQASVEAAFLIPLLLLTLLLLIQPAILLYTYLVMQGAAAEVCRIASTETLLEQNAEAVERYAMRRLAAVPQQDNFHVHEPTCTWDITYQGNDMTATVVVQITNQARPLPLFDFGLAALGLLNEQGNIQMSASYQLQTKSNWVIDNELGIDPKRWVERWNAS